MIRDERGAGTVLTAGVACVLCIVATLTAMGIAWFSVARQAERVAEVAALAGASAATDGRDPCRAAEVAASRNHAELARCVVRGRAPDVVVEVGVVVELRPRVEGMPPRLVRFATAGTV